MVGPARNGQRHFAKVTDLRVDRGQNHDLLEMVFMALTATICGADGWVDVERFAKSKGDWFRQSIELTHGVPSHDTFGRVFARLDTGEFLTAMHQWVDQFAGSLRQLSVDEKSNEIPAVPVLLTLLELEGAVVTLDAVHTQVETARAVTRPHRAAVLLCHRRAERRPGALALAIAAIDRPARLTEHVHQQAGRSERVARRGVLHRQPAAPRPTAEPIAARSQGNREQRALHSGCRFDRGRQPHPDGISPGSGCRLPKTFAQHSQAGHFPQREHPRQTPPSRMERNHPRQHRPSISNHLNTRLPWHCTCGSSATSPVI